MVRGPAQVQVRDPPCPDRRVTSAERRVRSDHRTVLLGHMSDPRRYTTSAARIIAGWCETARIVTLPLLTRGKRLDRRVAR